MANYIHLTTRETIPGELREQIRLLGRQLGFDPAEIEPLDKMARIRNQVAHAYWNVQEQELSNADLRAARRVLDELTQRLEAFIAARKPPRECDGTSEDS